MDFLDLPQATATIGTKRDDGDIRVLATFSNIDETLTPSMFKMLVLHARLLYRELGEDVDVFNRQDAPDYVTPDEGLVPD